MAYDFLSETTQEPQLAQQEQILNMLASQSAAADPNDLSNLEEIQDSDMNDLVSIDDEESPQEHEELSDEDADRMATDTHDFENEDLDPIDYQLMGYLMGDASQSPSQQQSKQPMQTGGYSGAGTIYSEASAPWFKNKVNAIKFSSLNRPTSKYVAQVPPTNMDSQTINNQASKVIQNDPIAQRMGIRIPTAKVGGAYTVGYQNGGAYNVGYQAGGTLFADDEATLRRGLNDASYKRAVLNLKGNNTVRGLDNHQPVAVSDGSKYRILRGPHDTDNFNGKVFEKRL